jgi:L-rhamnose-H+ transport protein
MQTLLGIIFHTIGGISSGSFYMPFKRVKQWSWETYWIVGGLFSWLIVPPLAAWWTVPGFSEIIREAAFSTKSLIYGLGVLWGIGGLTYGLGVRYLGMSLGNSVILGVSSALGSLGPAIYYNFNPVEGKESLGDMLQTSGGQLVLLGILICLVGIYVSGLAGMKKEGELSIEAKQESTSEFNFGLGIVIAVVSGLLSAFFNFGIEAGKPMADVAVAQGNNPLFQNNVTYVVLLWGGLTTNLLWCIYLNLKNGSYKEYTDRKTPILSNVLFAGLAGTLWYIQFFFYGMGESKLGNGASSWILHMATIILTANFWGLYLKEWSAVSRSTFKTFLLGIGLILLSIFLVGIGNSI